MNDSQFLQQDRVAQGQEEISTTYRLKFVADIFDLEQGAIDKLSGLKVKECDVVT